MWCPKKTADKLAEEAFKNGITHCETTGSLNKYITAQYFYNRSADNIRVYNDKVFIFSQKTLITVFNLPNKFIRTVNKIAKKKRLRDDVI